MRRKTKLRLLQHRFWAPTTSDLQLLCWSFQSERSFGWYLWNRIDFWFHVSNVGVCFWLSSQSFIFSPERSRFHLSLRFGPTLWRFLFCRKQTAEWRTPAGSAFIPQDVKNLTVYRRLFENPHNTTRTFSGRFCYTIWTTESRNRILLRRSKALKQTAGLPPQRLLSMELTRWDFRALNVNVTKIMTSRFTCS